MLYIRELGEKRFLLTIFLHVLLFRTEVQLVAVAHPELGFNYQH